MPPAAGGGQTVGLRLVIDVAPQRATLHPGRATDGVDPHRAHGREVDDDPAFADRRPGHVVAATAYCDLEVVLAREAHRRDDIGHARAPRDDGWTAVDGAVPDRAGGVVTGGGRQQQLSAERSAELDERGLCLWCLAGGHLVLPGVLDEPQPGAPAPD
jgi:hypothetical protein